MAVQWAVKLVASMAVPMVEMKAAKMGTFVVVN